VEIDRSASVRVEHEVEIAAPIQVVWEVLTNVEQWPSWFSEGESVSLAGALAPGATMRMKGRGTGTIKATIQRVESPHLFAWTSRMPGISAISVWRLEGCEDGTRVARGESIGGVLARVLRSALQRKLDGFTATWLRDLKAEAERRAF
jgi:uncharacterized protein YndB with AHSA1/START domain